MVLLLKHFHIHLMQCSKGAQYTYKILQCMEFYVPVRGNVFIILTLRVSVGIMQTPFPLLPCICCCL